MGAANQEEMVKYANLLYNEKVWFVKNKRDFGTYSNEPWIDCFRDNCMGVDLFSFREMWTLSLSSYQKIT